MNNDKDIVTLLEEYLNVMKDEMKNLNICVSALKNEVNILKNTNTMYIDSRGRCDDTINDMETRIRMLEKQDGTVNTNIQTLTTNLIAYKTLVENRTIMNEKSLDKVSGSVQRI